MADFYGRAAVPASAGAPLSRPPAPSVGRDASATTSSLPGLCAIVRVHIFLMTAPRPVSTVPGTFGERHAEAPCGVEHRVRSRARASFPWTGIAGAVLEHRAGSSPSTSSWGPEDRVRPMASCGIFIVIGGGRLRRPVLDSRTRRKRFHGRPRRRCDVATLGVPKATVCSPSRVSAQVARAATRCLVGLRGPGRDRGATTGGARVTSPFGRRPCRSRGRGLPPQCRCRPGDARRPSSALAAEKTDFGSIRRTSRFGSLSAHCDRTLRASDDRVLTDAAPRHMLSAFWHWFSVSASAGRPEGGEVAGWMVWRFLRTVGRPWACSLQDHLAV